MSELKTRTCEACHVDAPRATAVEIETLSKQIPEWDVLEVDGVERLRRVYAFDNFAEALRFSTSVGALAEQENHHPSILTEWGQVTVTWWTHKIGGLHVNDFIMSAKTDALLRQVVQN